ncbi:MAG: CoB--CoM heterodisulfide reductase iron-sulfur subunit A family protein [Chloroflexi bacterium]|nr:CoB--CoM heterodisulfide reductase iron-sulfur subunit A family protein [Chloroflexota bacterium]
MARIGVFICHCGSNIAGVVDIPKVMAAAKELPLVTYVDDPMYTCSETGQAAVREAIVKHGLTRVVVSACSPRMHEVTFRKALAQAGLNPYLLEMANIREQCAWVHGDDKAAATEKAIQLIAMAVAKVARHEPLTPKSVGVTKRALVIGGGIAGIQAALDLGNANIEVVLVEREPTIGGRMAQLDKTFPTLDCSSCILTPRMVEVSQHPKIRLLTYSEVKSVSGFVGNFEVEILQRARKVDMDKCTSCGICWQKCPEKVSSEFDSGMGKRSAIYIPFAQAVPSKPVIDLTHCRYIKFQEWQAAPEATRGKKPMECRICERLCPPQAVDWGQQDQVLKEKFGAIIVATGFQTFDYSVYGEYGGGKLPDVITGLQLERMLSASGPTGGVVQRPSDGAHPKTVVFLSCVGSRDDKVGRPYCSNVCCMYMAKQSILLKEHDPQVQSYVFYIDTRATGKGYEEFSRRAQEEAGTVYLRGRVSKIYQEGKKLVVMGEDSLMGRPVEIAADLVVLATGVEPAAGATELAQKLNIGYDTYGFLMEAHPKLRPVETQTDGIFVAGMAVGPKDVPAAVAHGSAAAVKAVGILSQEKLTTDPGTALVDAAKCVSCFLCEEVCPFNAVERETLRDKRVVARINESLCKGCGLCVSCCRPGAINLKGSTNQQLMAELMALKL